MGFFSKVFKSVKNVVKKIGKGIKSAFKKFGKFMGKIGILGQVAMMFILPGIGAALGQAFTGVANAAAAYGGVGSTVINAAGKAMQFVGKAVGTAGKVFNNVTKGVTDTLGNFAKTATNKLANKIGMENVFSDAAANFFGPGDSAFSRSFGETSRFANLTGDNINFEDIEKNRKLEAEKLDAINKTGTESSFNFESNDPRAYGQTEFIADPRIDQAIQDGTTNFSVSTDSVVADPSAFKIDQTGLLEGVDVAPEINVGEINVGTPTVEPSLLDRISTGIQNIPERVATKVGEIADDPLGYAGKGFEQRFQSGVQSRVMQEVGIEAKPEYNVQNISNVAYVPSFESFGGAQQQYGAQEIMSPRAFEQNVVSSANPYGYTAFQYNQYMSQYA